MNNPETQVAPKNTSLLYPISLVLLQSLLSIAPGVLLYHNASGANWEGASLLIIYLLVSNFSELVVRTQYRRQKNFPMVAYVVKILICSALIIYFCSKTQWQFALLLFAYELFQTLANSRQLFYLDSVYYTFLNPLFKGFVLNLLFLMKPPLFFQSHQITSLIPAFLGLLALTLFQQGQVTQRNRKKIFIFSYLFFSLVFVLSLFYFNETLFVFWRVIVATVLTVVATFIAFQTRNLYKAETLLNALYLIAFIVLYV